MVECVLLWGIGGSARGLVELIAQQRNWTVYRTEQEQEPALRTERLVAIIECRSVEWTFAACTLLRERCRNARILGLVQPFISDEASRAIARAVDDRLLEPSLENELAARVGRLYHDPSAASGASEHGLARVAWGPLDLRFDERMLFIDGRPCELTPRQERLLSRLIRAAGSVVRNDELWLDFGVATPPNLVNIRVHMHALRKRLGAAGSLIVTYPSVGYGIGVMGPTWSGRRSEQRRTPA